MATAATLTPADKSQKNESAKKESTPDTASPSVQQIFQVIDRLSSIQIGKHRDSEKILIVTKILEHGKPIDRITIKELVKLFEV